MRTKRPQLEARLFEAHLDVGNAGRRNVGVVANQPLSERAALRVALNYHELAGFFKNDGVVLESYSPGALVTRIDDDKKGDRENGERSLLIRPSLRIEPNEAWRIDLVGEYWQDKGDGTANWTQCYQPGKPAAAAWQWAEWHSQRSRPVRLPLQGPVWGRPLRH